MLTGHRHLVVSSQDENTYVERADTSYGRPGSFNAGQGTQPDLNTRTLEGFHGSDPNSLIRAYKEMYEEDAVSGAIVDLMASMPWSDFTLSGIRDNRRLQKYTEAVEAAKLKSFFPKASTDYYVLGKFVGSVAWNPSTRNLAGIMPHSQEDMELIQLPMFGADPIIKVKLREEVFAALQNRSDPRVRQYFSSLPKSFVDGLKTGTATLSEDETLFIARRGLTDNVGGVSLFSRMLPIWLMEKALLRGTLEQSYRRQRAILHVSVGDTEWEPTQGQLDEVAGMFLRADQDPTGAVVVTRQGIETIEVRRGDDMWKHEDVSSYTQTMKLRAAGVSESFLTGDVSYSTAEKTLSVFIEQVRDFRGEMTNKICYEKLFPMVALANGYRRSRSQTMAVEEARGGSKANITIGKVANGTYSYEEFCSLYSEVADGAVPNITGERSLQNLDVPVVHWHKSLKPEADRDYLDMLTTLEEKGVPVPLRTWAAAGGLSFRDLEDQREEDSEIRENWKDWITAITDFKEATMPGGGGGMFASELPPMPNTVGRKSFLDRDFGDQSELMGEMALDSKGRRIPLSREAKKNIRDKTHKTIAEAAANLAKKENHDELKKREALKTHTTVGWRGKNAR